MPLGRSFRRDLIKSKGYAVKLVRASNDPTFKPWPDSYMPDDELTLSQAEEVTGVPWRTLLNLMRGAGIKRRSVPVMAGFGLRWLYRRADLEQFRGACQPAEPKAISDSSEWLNVDQAMELLGVADQTLYNRMKIRPCERKKQPVGNGRWRFVYLKSDLEQLRVMPPPATISASTSGRILGLASSKVLTMAIVTGRPRATVTPRGKVVFSRAEILEIAAAGKVAACRPSQ